MSLCERRCPVSSLNFEENDKENNGQKEISNHLKRIILEYLSKK